MLEILNQSLATIATVKFSLMLCCAYLFVDFFFRLQMFTTDTEFTEFQQLFEALPLQVLSMMVMSMRVILINHSLILSLIIHKFFENSKVLQKKIVRITLKKFCINFLRKYIILKFLFSIIFKYYLCQDCYAKKILYF